MVNPEDNVLVVLKSSCTVDEAVAKMLGWLRGPYRDRYVQVTQFGIPLESLKAAHSLGGTLVEQLQEMRDAALQAFFEAGNSDADVDEIKQKDAEVQHCDELILRAYEYQMAITDELALPEPALRVDPSETARTGETHITLVSLDEWASKPPFNVSVKGDRQAQVTVKPDSNKGIDSESAGDEEKGKVARGKYDNLLTTFAFLLDAYLEKAASSYKHDDGRPKVDAIAKLLEKMATTANKGERLRNQRAESIKSRIEDATRIRREQLPLR
jgi:hypothetical protein